MTELKKPQQPLPANETPWAHDAWALWRGAKATEPKESSK